MQLTKTNGEFCSRGTQVKVGYRISQSPELMNELSNRLYGDKIAAVIRELSTNAWDSHVLAGNTDVAPRMTLPCSEDPTFRLRDFGTGLSQEQLETMYIEYGNSDKNHSNDFNGCFGLGSKSPFAYSSSFTTISYYNGVKYIYVNTKDKAGEPSLLLMHSEPTDEPNGLEISLAVDKSDLRDFRIKAGQILQWFPKPFDVVSKDVDFSMPKQKYLHTASNWKLREYDMYADSVVIMGNVAYPISAKQLIISTEVEVEVSNGRNREWYDKYNRKPSAEFKKEKQVVHNKKYSEMLNNNFELHFDLGEVEMALSREALEYTDKTIKAIQDRLDEALVVLTKEMEDSIKGAKNLWQARLKYQENNHGKLSRISNIIGEKNVQWNGQRVDQSYIRTDSTVDPLNFSLVLFEDGGNRRKTPIRTDYVYRINVAKNTAFYVADMKRGNYTVSQEVIMSQENTVKRIYLIKDTNPGWEKQLCDLVGCDPSDIKRCSEVVRDVTIRKAQKVKRENVFKLKTNLGLLGSRNAGRFWESSSIDFKQGGVFVEINSWQAACGGNGFKNFKSPDRLCDFLKSLNELGIVHPDIIGVKTCVVSKYEKSSKWTNVTDWAKEQVKDYMKTSKEQEYIPVIEDYDNFNHKDLYSRMKNEVVPHLKKTDSNLVKVVDMVEKSRIIKKDWKTKISNLRKCLMFLNMSIKDSINKVNLADEHAKVEKEYCVIQLLGSYDLSYARKTKVVIELMNLIDENSCKKGQGN